jgi:hypothetical protein
MGEDKAKDFKNGAEAGVSRDARNQDHRVQDAERKGALVYLEKRKGAYLSDRVVRNHSAVVLGVVGLEVVRRVDGRSGVVQLPSHCCLEGAHDGIVGTVL